MQSEPSRVPSSSQGHGGMQHIGRYELVRRIALGGMAELFLGRVSGISGFEKQVVVKRILPHLASDGEFVAMFGREARIAATLEHPNIVHVSDLGHDGRDYYLVMPLLVGKDLLAITRELERRGQPLPLPHAIAIGVAIAAGLDYAHYKTDAHGRPLGIVHRDVSPSNIFVTYGGEIKLLDFGIARASSEVRITRPGTRKGKTRYTSPEQIQDLPLDGRSDVFSLGVILYELTCGRRPFDADSEAAAIERILHQPILPPTHWIPSYPRELARIVMRALAQDRGQRYPTARALREDLERFGYEQRLRASALAVGEFAAKLFGAPIESARDHASIPPPPSGVFDAPVLTRALGTAALPLGAGAGIRTAGPTRARRRWDETTAIAIIVLATITAVVGALTWWARL
jgi:eukaryotic-like serine/threonine-protein kinase